MGRTLPTNPGTNPTSTPGSGAIPAPITISGRVVLEDGGPLPGVATIERVCNGNPHAEGFTDSKGYFVVQLGQPNNGVIQDASEASGLGRSSGQFPGMGTDGFGSGTGPGGGRGLMDNRFSNCDLRARLSGFRSQNVSLIDRRALDNPDIGVILLHRLGAGEGTTVSVSSLTAPKDAHKAFAKGMDLAKKKNSDEAMKSYQKAVELYPKYADAWCALGKLQADKGNLDDAHKSFQAAADAEPRMPAPFLELALLDAHNHRWAEVALETDHVLRLNSFDYPQAFFYNAVANYNLKHLDAAEKSARSAERLDTRHVYPQVAHLLGVILLSRRDYNGAADEFRNYLVMAPQASDAPAVRKQLDEVEKLAVTAANLQKDQQ